MGAKRGVYREFNLEMLFDGFVEERELQPRRPVPEKSDKVLLAVSAYAGKHLEAAPNPLPVRWTQPSDTTFTFPMILSSSSFVTSWYSR